MGNEFVPRKAEKKRVKLKMAVQGPSGSGKTWGALALARNLWPEAKVCVIDTENESASLYADKFSFDTITLGPPFGTDRYAECIDAVVAGGYDVLIIDSITPQWDGMGGILRRKEEMDRRPGSNGYANWATFTPEHEAFKQKMMQAPIHVIATMRSKQEYVLTTNEKNKMVPKKVGLAPIQRDQMDYEFTLVFDVGIDHRGEVSKDRTGLFNEKVVDLADQKTADAIRGWLDNGVEPQVKESHQEQAATASQIQSQTQQENNRPSDNEPREAAYKIEGNKITIPVFAVDKVHSKKNNKDHLTVWINGTVQGHDRLTVWDEKLFDHLVGKAHGKTCGFEFHADKSGKFWAVDKVLFVGDDVIEEKRASDEPQQVTAEDISPF